LRGAQPDGFSPLAPFFPYNQGMNRRGFLSAILAVPVAVGGATAPSARLQPLSLPTDSEVDSIDGALCSAGLYYGRRVAFGSPDYPNRLWFSSPDPPRRFRDPYGLGDWVDVGDPWDRIVTAYVWEDALIIRKLNSAWRFCGDLDWGTLYFEGNPRVSPFLGRALYL
jgi:hypothetical protein